MRIAVTGADGLLGSELVRVLRATHHVVGLGRNQLDVANETAIARTIDQLRPDVIINAAAYTDVDRAETDRHTAYTVNAYGTGHLALAAERVGARFIFISTDYVFDGQKGSAYTETDQPAPINIYGESKRIGEQLASRLCSNYVIVRTAWLFGGGGGNFARKVVGAALYNRPIYAAVDVAGSPTYTGDLARFLLRLLDHRFCGILHAVNSGDCSKYQFAAHILQQLRADESLALPVALSELDLPAKRPANTALRQQAIADAGLEPLDDWRDAVRRFLDEASGGGLGSGEEVVG